MAQQLNIFVENKPGRLETITQILGQNNVNIITFSIQNRGDFGVVRFLVDKTEQAHLALADKGYACAVKNVLLVTVEDKPGNLHRLLKILSQNNVNITDIYGMVQPTNQGVCCLEIDDFERVRKILEHEGFTSIEETQILK